ncbi:MAG: 6-pyruvoyl-tetrahydropterin synthase-related protein [Clostridium sp.]
MKKRIHKKQEKKKKQFFVISIIILIILSVALTIYVNREGIYPLGSDTYGHIYKANILYDSIKNGDLFLNYDPNWYNGIQPYRYWGPLVYYIIAFLNFITNNIFLAYNLYILLIFIVGGSAFIVFGRYLGREKLGLILAILWMIVPYNLEIIYIQGNLPFSVSIWIVPYLFYFYYRGINENKIFNYIMISIGMALIALDHAMLAALTGVTLFIFSLIYSIYNKTYKKCIILLTYAFLGIFISSIWLIPALKGGIVNQDKNAAKEAMIFFATKLSDSINPFLRFDNNKGYYFGISFLIIAIFGVLFSKKEWRTGYIIPIIILITTTPTVMDIIASFPMGQLFWTTRLTAMALCMLFIALMKWNTLRRGILYSLIMLITIDSSIGLITIVKQGDFENNDAIRLDMATEVATQKVAMLDASEFESFPSYYLNYGKNKKSQVFGWAWQGATTGKNIVEVNEALENNGFHLMFDRSLELGADTLVVKKDKIKDYEELKIAANDVGFSVVNEDEASIVYKYPIDTEFGTQVEYDGIAIGKYAPNISLMFPTFTVGQEKYLEDYSYEDLINYKTIYLSGFSYKNKEYAENLIRSVANEGVKIVIDTTGMEEKFLGVTANEIMIKNNYGEVYYKGEKVEFGDFLEEDSQFKATFLTSEESNDSTKCIVGSRAISYLYERNNITFIGLNLPYFATSTRDENAIKIMEDILGYKKNTLPNREVVPIEVIYNQDKSIKIISEPNTIVPIAALDAFEVIDGEYEEVNNLVKTKTDSVIINIKYPYLVTGIVGSTLAIALIAIMSILIKKKEIKGV